MVKIHNSCGDAHLLLLKPDIKGTGTSSSLHSAEDNAGYVLSMEKRATTATWVPFTTISPNITLVLFLLAVCPHFQLSFNINTDLRPKFGRCCTRCWFQIEVTLLRTTLLSVKGTVWCIDNSTGSKSLSEASSFAEKIQLDELLWSFIIQHNILVNVNMIRAVWREPAGS